MSKKSDEVKEWKIIVPKSFQGLLSPRKHHVENGNPYLNTHTHTHTQKKDLLLKHIKL